VTAQVKLWFDVDVEQGDESWKVELGSQLMQHAFFRNLVLVLSNQTLSIDEITARIRRIEPSLKNADAEYTNLLINSLLALVSAAQNRVGDVLMPFLNVRIQLWMRELRRLVCSASVPPQIRFSDDLPVDDLKKHLPLVHCRECGAMGWSAIKRQNDDRFDSELQQFYRAYFNKSPTIHFIFPELDAQPKDQAEFGHYLCGACLHTGVGKPPERCPSCGSTERLLAVEIYNERVKGANDHVYGTHNCPYCHARNGLTIVGSRAASLLAVVIGQLFNSTYYSTNDKKLLAFSDSVQDASHRAGFFAARTYRFNFRTAIQRVLQTINAPVSLAQLPEKFVQHWRTQLPLPDYVATFLAPNMAWVEDYDALVKSGKIPDGSPLVENVEKRIGWEILSEFGFTARIGRTLEKTGCAIAFPAPDRLHAVSEKLVVLLRNEIGGWSDLTDNVVLQFLAGFIAQLRIRGAVDHPALGGYIQSWGREFMLSKLPFMPNFGKQSRAPGLLTTKRGVQRFDAVTASGASVSWYEDWLSRVLGPLNPQIAAFAEQVYQLTLGQLISHGLMTEYTELSHPVWALKPAGLMISSSVDQYFCDACGSLASAASEERAYVSQMPCRRFRCKGRYVLQPKKDDYYSKLYSRGQVHRIFTAEHTGLLDREDREALEERFTQQDKPASENLLSCTPTLEMGINIGDLSTVLLCSVPPTQSNYLQRVGRAGRRDGNAFNFTMAEGKPHDLYFYAEPQEMLSGAVTTPGVFLNAPAVLERQFVGFCFDRWVESGVQAAQLPQRMGQVLSNLKKSGDKGVFPFNWLAHIDTHRTALIDRFIQIFDDALTEDSRSRLTEFVKGDAGDKESLEYKVVSRLGGLEKERENLRRRVQRVNKTIKTKEASAAQDKNTAEEIDGLKTEKSALNKIIGTITSKQTFNFFTDEGLLPNYAFPEAGVLLRSIIYRKKKVPDKHGKYETQIFEYERSAGTAIHELAPANSFYAEKRKVQIDRVNLELSETEEWRFCNRCAHAVKEVLNQDKAACPKCGSPMWGDKSQKRQMVRLRQVEATTSDRASRVDDSSDAREPEFYNKHMLVETEAQYVEKAYRLKGDELPFGFEFLRKAEFREINFGQQTGIGETIEIAGREVPAEGFAICKGCGKVKIDHQKEFKHALTCRYHGTQSDDQFLDFLYLYRQFSSEAVRILLPVTSFGVSIKLNSFIAALYLGLKEKFRGSIEHLETAIVEEPVKDSQIKKQFLVLYDRVPGGTGYLKELAKSGTTMMELLETALAKLTACRCQEDPTKDGCYHCLYAFRVSRDMEDISRTEAISMLTAILEQKDEIIEIDSVSNISVNVLFDSELEARFMEALRRSKPGGEPVQLTKEVVNGKPGWFLKLASTSYRIEPQVELGEANGVTVPSKPDFVFYPVRSGHGLPVAVFTDGFRYHADVTAGNLRIGHDMAQRMALIKSGKYRVWSLTWQDVESQFKATSGQAFTNLTAAHRTSVQKLLSAYDDEYGTKALQETIDVNAFAGLMAYLYNPAVDAWGVLSFALGISHDRSRLCYCDAPTSERPVDALLMDVSWSDLAFPVSAPTEDGAYLSGSWLLQDAVGRPQVAMAVAGHKNAIRAMKMADCSVVLRLFDDNDLAESEGFQAAWNGFLHLSNLLQFFPSMQAVTTQGLMEHLYTAIPALPPASAVPDSVADLQAMNDELSLLTAPEVHPIIKRLLQAQRDSCEPGFELEGPQGEVIATAELAWPTERIAVLMQDELDDASVFEAHHWTVLFVEDCVVSPDLLLDKLADHNVRGE